MTFEEWIEENKYEIGEKFLKGEKISVLKEAYERGYKQGSEDEIESYQEEEQWLANTIGQI